MKLETKLVQIGNRRDQNAGAVNFPVYQSTAYLHPTLEEETEYNYTRLGNPTRTVLEEAIASLEKGDQGFACSSGMAALQTVFSLFSSGDHILVSEDIYGGTYKLFEEILKRYALTFTYVDLRDVQQVKNALQTNTKAIYIETPTNPMMQEINIRSITEIAKEKGLLTIVDNTFLTPYFQTPLELGADLVIHSGTKYLGGHNDVLAGFIVTKGKELSEKTAVLFKTLGAVLGPQDSWLMIRGLKTLALRMEKHQQNARQIVSFLQEHPLIEEVYYPKGVSGQTRGTGGMISFRVKQKEAISVILKSLQLISFTESLGGVESLMTYPAKKTHKDIPEEIRQKVGVDDYLLRLSVGIEDADDLIADLAQAFDKGAKGVNNEQ